MDISKENELISEGMAPSNFLKGFDKQGLIFISIQTPDVQKIHIFWAIAKRPPSGGLCIKIKDGMLGIGIPLLGQVLHISRRGKKSVNIL